MPNDFFEKPLWELCDERIGLAWANVRCLQVGEAVCLNGTHLGHNLPDQSGNRHYINLLSVEGGPPVDGMEAMKETISANSSS